MYKSCGKSHEQLRLIQKKSKVKGHSITCHKGTGRVGGGSRSIALPFLYRYDYKSNQQDATIQVNLLMLVGSTCFEQYFLPSSGAHYCTYNFWWYSPKLLPAGVMDELTLSFNSSMTPAGSSLDEYYQKL
jgi:hypothetical protein